MSSELTKEDLDDLTLRMVEQETEEMWDYPAIFFLLVDLPGEEKWGLILNENITEIINTQGDGPVDMLFTILFALKLPFAPDMPHGLTEGQKLLGFMLRTEGWRLSVPGDITQEELDEFTSSGKRYVDHPKAKEARGYTAVTEEHTSLTMQIRHEEPEVSPSTEGRVAEVLQAMLAAFKERHPEHA